MDTHKVRRSVKRFQSALIINHLIFLLQLWMLSWQRTVFSGVCLAFTALALGLTWFAVYRWYKTL